MASDSRTGAGGRRRGALRTLLCWAKNAGLAAIGAVVAYLAICLLLLLLLVHIDPPTTGVQIQRRIESWFEDAPYHKRYSPVPLARISDHLEHAVVAAEDGRFYQHDGVDWKAVGEALDDDRRRRRPRGGSGITQQLVKNLFLTTHRSYLRKGVEVPLAYLTELVLSKERILELYVNVIEWDRGVYGAEAAARNAYATSAAKLTREQAAALAACIPNPRRYSPQRMVRYRQIILRRMAALGW